jgi:serine/threonine protein kinase
LEREALVECTKGLYLFFFALLELLICCASRQKSTRKIVAIKVLDIDDADFQAYGEQKDEQLKDFNREIRILKQAQDSGAENLNRMIEALPVHSQLWLICEHCPGGSVKTLVWVPPRGVVPD